MEKNKYLLKTMCWLIMIALLINTSCISSTKRLGVFKEEKTGEQRVNREQTIGEPIIKIIKTPTAAEPDIGINVMAEKIKRDTILEKYKKTERIQKKTSGTGWVVIGAIGGIVGIFMWMINTINASDTTDSKGYPLTQAEKDENEDKYGPKADQGLSITLGGLFFLIVGLATDKKTIITEATVDKFEKTITRDTNIGEKVPLNNLVVTASTSNDQATFATSGTTNQEGNATLTINNILKETIATAKILPGNTRVEIKPQGGPTTSLSFNIEETITLMSQGKIDWSTGQEGLTPYPEAQLKIAGIPKANETVILQLNISNKKGKGNCYRLEALIKSDEATFNRRILVGQIKAGEEVTAEDKIQIPRLWLDRVVPLNISFKELHNNIPASIEARLVIEGLPRPGLAYSYQIIDDGTGNSVGNGDGRAQKGEALDIEITVNNTGSVPAKNTKASIAFTASPGKGVAIQRDSLSLGDLAPNESKKGRFTLGIKRIAQANEFQLNLDINENNLNVSTKDTIDIKIGEATQSKAIVMNPKPAYVTAEEITVRGGADADSIARFRLKKDNPLTIISQIGDWYKVDLGENRYGWVSKNEVAFTPPKTTASTTAPSVPTIIEVLQKAPPLIVIANPNKKVMETTDASLQIIGMAGDDRSVEKVDILINGTVVKTLASRGISVVGKPDQPPQEKTPTYSFEQEVALKFGQNEIKIIAYDDEGLTRTEVIKVERIQPRGEIHLVVVGISAYNDPNIQKLPYAENDAKIVLDFFQKDTRSPIKPENITFISGKQATSRGIRKAISSLANKAKEHDTVIFYYAGHGDIGKHPNKGTEYYLVPVDAEKEDLFSTAIELSEVQRLWSAVTSKRKVFIADACNSGGFTSLRGDVEGFEQGMGEGTVVMTASSRGQKALEVPQLKHGLFTYYLLEGLKGKADENTDNRISISELKKYIDKEVPNKAKELGSVQTPVIKIETTGEIYLSK